MASTIKSGKVPNKIDNTDSDKVIITEDKLYRKLSKHLDKVHKKREWVSAVGLVLTTVVPLITCEFKDFIFDAALWKAFFLLSALASCVYFFYSICVAMYCRNESIESIIKDIMTKD